MTATAGPSRRDVALAGHTGDVATAVTGWASTDSGVRATALGALDRMDALDDSLLLTAFTDTDAGVRRRAAEITALRPHLDLLTLLTDPDAMVVETAAWSCGEHETVADDVLDRLIDLTTGHPEPLVREAAAAALGAIGDARGLAAILTATQDKPAVRRRAVIALAPFEGDAVDEALQRALEDRDWQVRQAAEDLLSED